MERLKRLGMLGMYGFYEAADLTPARLAVGQEIAIVQSYMAHHQGMIMLSLVNYLQGDAMVRRFQCDPRIQSVELLLLEQIPRDAPIERQNTEARRLAPISPATLPVPGKWIHWRRSRGALPLEWPLQHLDYRRGRRVQRLGGHRPDPLAT
jgi:cyclic beta-1,2-glucan synthetase